MLGLFGERVITVIPYWIGFKLHIMKSILLSLSESLIIESVKSETLIKGRIDKASDSKAAELAFNEEAGDEEFHERKLHRTMHTSLSRLMSKIGDYVEARYGTSASNVYDVSEGVIEITLRVSDRFNESLTEPLARLCSKFIEDHMLYLWWGTFNVKQAEFYKSLWMLDLEDISACFTKTAPVVPQVRYTEYINTQLGDTFKVLSGELFSLTYLVSDGVIDDVEAVSSDEGIVTIGGKKGRTFSLRALGMGVADVTLYSKHSSVEKRVKIIVS